MADRREPEQREPIRRDRSLMVNSPLRWAVLVAFVLGGILVLSKGFGGTPSAANPGGGPAASNTPPSSPTPSHTPTQRPSSQRTPSLTGITVAIYNGAGQAGLASDQRQQLDAAGWDVISIGNAPTSVTTTTIYYLSDAKTQAEYLKSTAYPKADVQPAPPAFRSAKISVVIGSDFTTTQ